MRVILPVTLVAGLLLSAVRPADADIKAVAAVKVYNTRLLALWQKAALLQDYLGTTPGKSSGNPFYLLMTGQPVGTTLSVSGKKTRVDMPRISFILDSAARTAMAIDHRTRTATAAPYEEALKLLSDQDLAGAAGHKRWAKINVQQTSQVQTVAGYRARCYIVTVSALAHRPVEMHVWAAPSLPRLPLLGVERIFAPASPDVFRKIPGAILMIRGTNSDAITGTTTFQYTVKSVSTRQLPPGTFAAPPGYSAPQPQSHFSFRHPFRKS